MSEPPGRPQPAGASRRRASPWRRTGRRAGARAMRGRWRSGWPARSLLLVALVGTGAVLGAVAALGRGAPPPDDAALAARIDRLGGAAAAAPAAAGRAGNGDVNAAVQRLDRRVGALEAKPAAPRRRYRRAPPADGKAVERATPIWQRGSRRSTRPSHSQAASEPNRYRAAARRCCRSATRSRPGGHLRRSTRRLSRWPAPVPRSPPPPRRWPSRRKPGVASRAVLATQAARAGRRDRRGSAGSRRPPPPAGAMPVAGAPARPRHDPAYRRAPARARSAAAAVDRRRAGAGRRRPRRRGRRARQADRRAGRGRPPVAAHGEGAPRGRGGAAAASRRCWSARLGAPANAAGRLPDRPADAPAPRAGAGRGGGRRRRRFSPIIPGMSRSSGRAGRSTPRSGCWPAPWRSSCWLVALALARGAALRRVPRNLRRRRAARRRQTGEAALTRGLVALAAGAGGGGAAARAARRGAARRRADGLAARRRGGDPGGRQRAAARAPTRRLLERPETEFLGLRGLIGQALRAGDDDTARRLAERARQLRPDALWLVDSLLVLAARAGDWAAARDTLAGAARRQVLPAERARHHQGVVLHELSRDAERRGELRRAAGLAAKAQALAADLAAPACHHARLLIGLGRQRAAARSDRARLAHRAAPRPRPPLSRHPPRRAAARPRRVVAASRGAEPARRAKATSRSPRRRWRRGSGARRAATWRSPSPRLRPERAVAPAVPADGAARGERATATSAAARDWLDRAIGAPPDPCYVCTRCGARQPGMAGAVPGMRRLRHAALADPAAPGAMRPSRRARRMPARR